MYLDNRLYIVQACRLSGFHSGVSGNINSPVNNCRSRVKDTAHQMDCGVLVAWLPLLPCCLSSEETVSTRLHLYVMMGHSVAGRPVTVRVQSSSQQGN